MAVLATAGSIVSASPLAALAAASRVPQAFQAANGRRRLSVARILVSTGMLSKAIALDRAVQRRLYAARNQQWAVWYQAARQHIRKLIA
jgi:hypothetical protein